MLVLLGMTILSCGTKRDEANGAGNDPANEVTVEWYSIKDAGLLSAEKRGDSLAFTLLVGAGESCTGETSGVALRQADGSYRYGDSDCTLTFKPTANGITLEEAGDLCDHGAHCSFGGDYTKVASEEISPASADVMSWMRKTTSDFSCVLEKQYGYKPEKYSCDQKVTIDYSPNEANWNEGPEFPQEKATALHPLVKNVSVGFEHGDLYMLTVTLEKKMIIQDVQRIFSLPAPFDDYGNDKYSNVMSLTFDNYSASDKPQFSVNPIFVSSFTLIGFEHMGAGDMDMASEPVNETTITYEYRETGETFTLIDEGGPGPYEFTCTGIATVKTSSTLAAQGSSSYAADKMTDMDESTAWADGKVDLGIGEWIEFTLTDAYKKWGYEDKDFIAKAISGGFVIQTGYAKSPSHWKKNSRPIKLRCYLNGKTLSTIQLRDTPDFQIFSIFPDKKKVVDFKEGDVIRFEIIDVVKGTEYEDACISEFHIDGSCG